MDAPPPPAALSSPPPAPTGLAAVSRPQGHGRWDAPVTPLRITRQFRVAAPFAAGGHRGIDLAARPGADVRAPCSGSVVFAGRVAGGPPTLSIDCGELRATLQRARSVVGRGTPVRRGQVVAIATTTRLDLGARRTHGRYVDPATLLGAGPRSSPPLTARRRAPRPRPPATRAYGERPAPAQLDAVVTPAVPAPVPPPRSDLTLGLAGTLLGVGGVLAAAAAGLRRRAAHRRRGQATRAHTVRAR